jgi:membrane associated rhomboid family serine protease
MMPCPAARGGMAGRTLAVSSRNVDARGQPRRPSALNQRRMPPLPPVTQALMLICTAVFCAQQFTLLTDLWFALWPISSGRFAPWQLLSYAFLHGGFGHLFFNMLAIWMFGSELERLWGGRRYIYLLLASVLTAALVQLLLTTLLGSNAPTVGASGAVFGLLLCYGMLFPNRTVMLLIPPIPMKARTLVIVFGVLELFLGVYNSGDGVAHFAHLGGMLGAWLLLLHWRGRLPFGRRR